MSEQEMPFSVSQVVEPNLFEIRLGAGRVNGFLVDWAAGWNPTSKRYQSSQWLSLGYDGVVFVGEGVDVTTLVPENSMVSDTVFSMRHPGIVKLKNLTVETGTAGKGKAVSMGFENLSGPVVPKFACHLENVKVSCPVKGVWGLFGYQCDWKLENVTFDLAKTNEHGLYAHGFSTQGVYIDRLNVLGVGAEAIKFTARPGECRYVPNTIVHVKNSLFRNWYQPHSWRGGAGITLQGSSANLLVEDCRFVGAPDSYNRSRCFFIDDSGSDYYDENGVAGGPGAPNGHVVVKRTAFSTFAVGPDWFYNIGRMGPLGSKNPPWVARSLRMVNCGVYGANSLFSISGPLGDSIQGNIHIANCNTPAIKDLMGRFGFYNGSESRIAGPNGLVPFSQGLII